VNPRDSQEVTDERVVTLIRFCWGEAMSRPYSLDLRNQVVASIEVGASRHEAAERFEVSASSATRWMQRFVQSGTAAAKLMGGQHVAFVWRDICESRAYPTHVYM
jgi:transposase-like protein